LQRAENKPVAVDPSWRGIAIKSRCHAGNQTNSEHVKKKVRNVRNLPVIGWREWVKLPDLGVNHIKVKVDTGARSSALHAYDVQQFIRDGKPWVRFKIHPIQRDNKHVVKAEARILEYRSVKSTNGKAAMRPVIVTSVSLLGATWKVELTLANRDEMGFRMLLGREALRRRLIIDPGGSYYGGKPNRKATRRK
jgi:hypothetical protein